MTATFIVNDDNRAMIVCPECKRTIDHDVSQFMGINMSIKLKARCRKCNHHFSFKLQRRKFFRKEVNLSGICIFGKGNSRIPITVVDMSQGGLKLKMNRYHDFKSGDMAILEFQLDDKNDSLIRRDICIRSIKDIFLSVQFNSSEHYDKLGLYIIFS